MIDEFNQLPWHDAVLVEMRVNRNDPGNQDLVELSVCWPDGSKHRIIFDDCYRLSTDMNFGVIAPDSIDSATAETDTADVSEILKKWRAIGTEIEALARFELRTSSTGSTIQIFAKSFRLEQTA